MPFLIKTILKNCLFLLKYHILAVLALGEIQNFQNSSIKSFITSTTGRNVLARMPINIIILLLQFYQKKRLKAHLHDDENATFHIRLASCIHRIKFFSDQMAQPNAKTSRFLVMQMSLNALVINLWHKSFQTL